MNEQEPTRHFVVTSIRVDAEKHRETKLKLMRECRPSFSEFVERCMDEYLAREE